MQLLQQNIFITGVFTGTPILFEELLGIYDILIWSSTSFGSFENICFEALNK